MIDEVLSLIACSLLLLAFWFPRHRLTPLGNLGASVILAVAAFTASHLVYAAFNVLWALKAVIDFRAQRKLRANRAHSKVLT